MVAKIAPDPLYKIKLEQISGSTIWSFIQFVFIICPSREQPNLSANYLLLLRGKLFFKKKKGLKLVFLPQFLHDIWRKIFLALNSFNLSNFIFWLPLLFEIPGNTFTVIFCVPVCDVINFEIYLSFLIKPFSHITKNVRTKI